MILGIIPARGGSKGILRKNIRQIAGKPLIAWTIEAAKKSKLIDKCLVSTEDEEIARVAKDWGADVFLRPAELATDEALIEDVLKHIASAVLCEIVVLLQPTSPVRKPGLIDECITEFIKNGYDSLATGLICKYIEYGKNDLRRQDIDGFFYDDGNVYVMNAGLLRKGERYGRKIGRKIISRRENVEIDDEFDFWLAEKILAESE